MKLLDGWYWPDHEEHMVAWIKTPKNRVVLNDRPAYQGRKQIAALKHCRASRTAIDVGAHVGLWAYNLAQTFDRVQAFEPVKEHRLCFAKNVVADNVHMHGIALGDRVGNVAIRTTKGSSGDSRIAGDGDVMMLTLDSFEFDDVDLIKVDCEGYEENVLRGSVDTIRRCRPTICVEQKRDMATRFGLQPQGGVRLLEEMGYRIAEEISGDYIMVPA